MFPDCISAAQRETWLTLFCKSLNNIPVVLLLWPRKFLDFFPRETIAVMVENFRVGFDQISILLERPSDSREPRVPWLQMARECAPCPRRQQILSPVKPTGFPRMRRRSFRRLPGRYSVLPPQALSCSLGNQVKKIGPNGKTALQHTEEESQAHLALQRSGRTSSHKTPLC